MSPAWRAAHYAILVMFLVQTAYCFWVVLVVLRPDEVAGPFPLAAHAATVPVEVVVKRRLYAIEGWLSGGVAVLYLAITEVVPRQLEARRAERPDR